MFRRAAALLYPLGCGEYGGLLAGFELNMLALSRASNSDLTVSSILSRVHVLPNAFVTITRIACGSLFMRIEIIRFPYEPELTPRLVRLLTWVSTLS